MTAGIFNPTDTARSTVSRPARTALGDAVRKWYQAGIFPNAQDFNDLIAQLRAAGDAFGVPDAEGDDEYLLKMLRAAGREKLTSPRTYYVRSDGSDSNDGLSDTAGGAFLTVQKAINTVWNLNLNGQAVVIQSRLATCTENVICQGSIGVNSSQVPLVTIRGDTTTPANCVIQPASGNGLMALFGAEINVEGFSFVAANNGLTANFGSYIRISGACNFGACGFAHMAAAIGGRIARAASITINGSAARSIYCAVSGSYEGVAGTTVTISGTPAFSTAFVYLDRNSNYFENSSSVYSGSATGFKFFVESGSSLNGTTTIVDVNSILPGDKLGVVRPIQTTPLQPMRNIVINGDGLLQNGPSGAVGDDVYGLHDRWYVLSQSGNVTPSTVNDVADGVPHMIRLTNSHGSAQRVGYAQIISSDVAKRFRGKRLTAAVKTRASASTSCRVSILSWSGTADSLTSDIVNNWASTTFTVGNFFTNPAGLSVLAAVSGSMAAVDTLYNITASTWVADVPSDCNNLIVFVHTNSSIAASATFDFRVQLEDGQQATPFELRPPQLERLLTARRIQRKTVNSINGTIFVPLDEMAAAPTVTIVSGAGSVANATKDGFHLTHTSVASHDILCTAEL